MAETPKESTAAPEGQIFVVDPHSGKRGAVPLGQLDEYLSHGYEIESAEASNEARLEHQYGDRGGAAALQGAASAITFGGSDIVLNELDPEGARETKERNPWEYVGGNIGGAVLGGGVGLGGALTKAGVAAERAVTAGKAVTLGTKVLGAGTRGVVEGVGYGTGTAVSELALQEDPLTWEGAAATIGSNVLGGAVLGGGIGVGGKLLAEGAAYAKGAANRKLEALAKGEEAVDRGAYPELAGMDERATAKAIAVEDEVIKANKAEAIKQNRLEHQAETDAIKVERTARAKQLYQEATAFEKEAAAAENFVPTSNAKIRTNFRKGTRKLMGGLDDEADFVEKLGKGQFQKGLQEQETALKRVMREAEGFDAQAEQFAFMDELASARKSKVPRYEKVNPDDIVMVPARDLEKAGLYELPMEKLDTTRLARVKKGLAEKVDMGPIDLAMDPEGRLFVSDGRHRLRAALDDNLELPVKFDHSIVPDVSVDAAVIGKPSPGEFYLSPENAATYGRWKGIEVPENGITLQAQEMEAFRQAAETGEVLAPKVQRLQTAEAMLEKNNALQTKFKDLQSEPVTQKLRDIETKLEQIKADTTPTPRKQALKAHQADLQHKDLGHHIAQGLGGLVGGNIGMWASGPIGAVAGGFVGRDIGIKIYDRFVKKIISGNASRTKSIAASLTKAFAGGAEKVAKASVQATKIIPAIQYATKDDADRVLGPDNTRPSKDQVVTAFRARARELNSVTEPGMNGVYQVRMQALQAMHDRMAGLWAIAPGVANGVEKTQAAKLQFLASKLPRDPTPPHLQIGPSTWEPNKAEIAKFARIMQAAEHPEVVAEHVAQGVATPDEVETLKAVYPSHYEDMRQQCFTHAATIQRTLPYVQRLNLGLLLDVDIDPALTPQAMSVYQAPPPPPEQAPQPTQNKPMPMGMVEPTRAQRYSAK
jgi:hypothetical protein